MTNPATHPLPPTLPRGIEAFARQAASRTSLEALRDALAALPEHLLPLARCATFEPIGHTRRVLFDTPTLVLELCGWLPGQRTEPHDHGPARCAFRVMAGVAVESRHHRDAQARVCEIACDGFLTGSVLVCEPGEIHAIANDPAESEPLVTLHLFSPAPRMRTYPLTPQDTKETRA
ncbi:MAG: hypothetical protein DYG94_06045 [Leptolyngbya sp. PLA3]|nr:MAG: hypothetical protein EDM82_03525 [Cyanobacteria bacterium CYA]MCE7968290.1 hypothetical protein [Leptolyngbya sp. PL-A3]